MGFGQDNLQPSLLNKLVLDVCVEWFINRKKVISTLRDHVGAGIHSNIYLLEADGVLTKFVWSHVALQPFGQPTPIQCKECKALRSWKEPKLTMEHKEVISVFLKCRVCPYSFTATKNLDGTMRRVGHQGVTELSERGEWFYTVIPKY